ncbi:MAG: hypothetical protein J7J72_05640 [Bacteroidales bacterium]|nr:hypothetical protein [Bacteroidales bacterium]
MKVTFNKVQKPKQFSFKTRFYDEKKEAEAKRKAEIEDKIKNPDRIDIRKEIQMKWRRDDRIRSKSKKYALYFYLFALIIILYFILK